MHFYIPELMGKGGSSMEDIRYEGTMLGRGDARTGLIEISDRKGIFTVFPLGVGQSFERTCKGKQYRITRINDSMFKVKLAA